MISLVPLWAIPITDILCPIGTDTALLLRLYLPSMPRLLTTNEAGPTGCAYGPIAGSDTLTEVALNAGSPGLMKKGPTLPPAHAQNKSTATPLAVSKPVPCKVTSEPCGTTVSTLSI